MDRPKSREAVYIFLLLSYIVVQVIVPLNQLRYRFHTPLGWKMFAYYGPVPVRFRVVNRNGSTIELTSASGYPPPRTLRPEVDRARFVPPAVCARFPFGH
jgi:hypothetical protein